MKHDETHLVTKHDKPICPCFADLPTISVMFLVGYFPNGDSFKWEKLPTKLAILG